MSLVETSFKEVMDIIMSSARPVNFNWTGEFQINETFLPITKIESIANTRDFENGYTDEILLTAMIKLSDYTRFIYPARTNLLVVLRRLQIGEMSDEGIAGSDTIEKTYRCILTSPEDPHLQAATLDDTEQSLFKVTVQLLERSVEQMRLLRTGGIFYQASPLDVLQTLVGKYAMSLSLPDDEMVNGVEVVKPEVDRTRPHVIIPHGTPLLGLPDYLQNACGGIYNQSIGLYLSNQIWYVYPLYRTNRYSTAEYSADIIIVPKSLHSGIERTFAIKDQHLFIAITGEVEQKDMTDINYLQDGNGIRFSLASPMWDEFITTSKNISTTNIDKTFMEYVIGNRKTNIDNVPFSSERITDNAAKQSSALAKRKGQLLSLTWQNADPSLIYPGMPIKVQYTDESKEADLEGVVLAVVSMTGLNRPGMLQTRYRTNAKLIVFMNKPDAA